MIGKIKYFKAQLTEAVDESSGSWLRSSLSERKFGMTADSSPCKHATKCLKENNVKIEYKNIT